MKNKKFIVAEIRELLNKVQNEEISFSRFVEILNEKSTDNYRDIRTMIKFMIIILGLILAVIIIK